MAPDNTVELVVHTAVVVVAAAAKTAIVSVPSRLGVVAAGMWVVTEADSSLQRRMSLKLTFAL